MKRLFITLAVAAFLMTGCADSGNDNPESNVVRDDEIEELIDSDDSDIEEPEQEPEDAPPAPPGAVQ